MHFHRRRHHSFTLIELLVVMAVIAILAAITLGAAGYVNKKAAASRAQAEIAAMEAALERYKVDNGIYPTTAAISPMTVSGGQTYTTNTSTYNVNATVLYTNLSGKQSYTATATTPVYMEFKLNQLNTNTVGAPPYVQDPFGYPYGYVCDPPGTTNNFTVLFNQGFFDLWSTAGQTGSGSSTNVSQFISNWKGN
jgi:prepilin-type N-terminal cleavage/methylation domain-containing protein